MKLSLLGVDAKAVAGVWRADRGPLCATVRQLAGHGWCGFLRLRRGVGQQGDTIYDVYRAEDEHHAAAAVNAAARQYLREDEELRKWALEEDSAQRAEQKGTT